MPKAGVCGVESFASTYEKGGADRARRGGEGIRGKLLGNDIAACVREKLVDLFFGPKEKREEPRLPKERN